MFPAMDFSYISFAVLTYNSLSICMSVCLSSLPFQSLSPICLSFSLFLLFFLSISLLLVAYSILPPRNFYSLPIFKCLLLSTYLPLSHFLPSLCISTIIHTSFSFPYLFFLSFPSVLHSLFACHSPSRYRPFSFVLALRYDCRRVPWQAYSFFLPCSQPF